MALKDELLSLISRYTGGRVHRDGGGSVSTADILDGMSAADMTRDLRQGPPVAPPVAGPDVRRRLQDKVMRGIPLSPLEHEQLRMYVEQDLPARREIKSRELGPEDAGRFMMGMLPQPRIMPREGAEPPGPDIRAEVRNRALAGRPLPGDEALLASYLENELPARRERAANYMDEGATAGSFAHEAMPFLSGPAGSAARPILAKAAQYAAPYAKPALMASPLAALFSADAGDAQAQQRPQAAAPADREATMALQRDLKAKGLYAGPIDGELGEGTRAAIKALEAREGEEKARREREADRELERLRLQTKAKETELEGQKVEDAKTKRETGNQRLKEIQDGMPWHQTALKDYGPVIGNALGFGMGMWSKGMAGKATERASEKAATRADELMSPVAGNLPQRVANVNQFWGEGQRPMFSKREVPFLPDTSASQGFKANAAAPTAADLYQPNKVSQYGRDAAVLGLYGTEYGVGEFHMKPQAQAELEAARAAVREDPSEANISRLVKAQNSAGIADVISNMGRMGGITHAGMLVKSGGPQHTRPDVAKAEAERIRIDSLLAKKPPGGNAPPSPPSGTGPQPPPLPPTLPPGTSLSAPAAPPAAAQSGLKMPPSLPDPATAVNLPVSSKPPAAALPAWAGDAPSGIKLPKDHYWDVNLEQARHVRGQFGPGSQSKPASSSRKAPSKQDKSKTPTKVEPEDDVAGFLEGKAVPKKPDPVLTEDTFKGRARGGEVLDMARRYANGGSVLPPGLVAGNTPGRADALDVAVPNGAYIIPADCVSGIKGADNNTEAGAEIWKQILPKPTQGYAAGGPVDIKISHGEIVVGPDQVAALGGGDIQKGHRIMDALIHRVREENINHLASLPPPAKS